MTNTIETLSKGFYTTESSGGKGCIKIDFGSLAELHAAHDELRALLAQSATQVIDLDAADWQAIQQSASESKWMPPEYMRNEWVSDVCSFLRDGRPAQHKGEPVAEVGNMGFGRFYASAIQPAMDKTCSPGDKLYRHPAEQPAPNVLKAFANEMIDAAFEGGSFDGGDIQDIAVRHGLLRIESRDEACGEACNCTAYGFPAECYRKTPTLAGRQS